MASGLVGKIKAAIQPHVNENDSAGGHCCSILTSGPGYASPADALKGPREKLLYITAVYTGSPFAAVMNAGSTPCLRNIHGPSSVVLFIYFYSWRCGSLAFLSALNLELVSVTHVSSVGNFQVL